MKRSELFFGAILLPIDYLALLLAGAAAYYLRISPTVQRFRPAVFELDLPFLPYMELVAVVSFMTVGVLALEGLYAMQVTRRPITELTKIFSGLSIGMLIVILYMFLRAELFNSRFILVGAYIISIILVSLGRYLIRQIQIALLRRGFGIHRVALVGNSRYSKQITDAIQEKRGLGYRISGNLIVARWDALEELYRRHGIDEVIQTDPSMPEEDVLMILDFCDKYKLDYKYIPNSFETHAAHVRFRQVGGVPVMELMRTPLDGWGRVAKRVVDITGAIVGVFILSPILLATALAIKIEEAGPILYKQERIGKNRQPFKIYKFRSMYLKYCRGKDYGGHAAEQLELELRQKTNERSGPLFKMKKDPRVTKVGNFIRRWRIDELPQLINVLRGEMSLLGPRPHLPEEVKRYDKHHQKLFNIKPGMSGMAQVNGNAGLSFEQEASLDITYIESWSLKLDAILLLKTIVLLLTDRNAV